MTEIPTLTSYRLRKPGIAHGFFTRRGGVSRGIYDSLNCGLGSKDDSEAVDENRRRAATALDLGPEALVTLFQIHSATVVAVGKTWAKAQRPRADALVTRTPGIGLGILAADCAPILFADAESGVIGAAHAGWKGARIGVAEATVGAMESLGADRRRIDAAVGPCIGAASYEVGPEFPHPFLADDPDNTRFFAAARRPEHFLFDLAGYVTGRLRRLGLRHVDRIDRDTCAESQEFFSYRRSVLSGESDYGRAISVIALT
jgi:YfiH family protein